MLEKMPTLWDVVKSSNGTGMSVAGSRHGWHRLGRVGGLVFRLRVRIDASRSLGWTLDVGIDAFRSLGNALDVGVGACRSVPFAFAP